MADIRAPGPLIDLELGDLILESRQQARDNMRVIFDKIQQMPEGQPKRELQKLHADLANKLTLATKERDAAQNPKQAKSVRLEDPSTTATNNEPLVPGYLAVAGSFFKSVAKGAFTASVPSQHRVLQTLPNGLTYNSPRPFHLASDSHAADDTSHDKYRDARHILQRLNKTDSPVSITGREDVRRQFPSHHRDIILPVDESITKNHDDEVAGWACIVAQVKARKARRAIEDARRAIDHLDLLEDKLATEIEERKEGLSKEARQILDGSPSRVSILMYTEERIARVIEIQKKEAEQREIKVLKKTLENIVAGIEQELGTPCFADEAGAEIETSAASWKASEASPIGYTVRRRTS